MGQPPRKKRVRPLLRGLALLLVWKGGSATLWHQQSSARPSAAAAAVGGAAGKRYYVLATVAGLDVAMLNVFLQSWRRHSPHTRVVLWVEQGTALDDHGVDAEVIRFTQATDIKRVKMQRYQLYQPYLTRLLARGFSGGVVLADARDVFIQSDPWQHSTIKKLVAEDSMLFSLEGRPEDGEGKPIHESIANHRWLAVCFGRKVQKRLKARPISCSGVTVGGLGAVSAYVDQLLHVAFNVATPGCRESNGADQGVHNFMLHSLGPSGKLKFAYHVLSNWESPVFTAGHGWPHFLDSAGVFQRGNGSTPPIVHQYDKRGGVRVIVKAMYPVLDEEYRVWGPGPEHESPAPRALLNYCKLCKG